MEWAAGSDFVRTDRSRVIQRSTRCFIFGMIGAIPLVGIVPACLAIKLYHRIARDTGEVWKPELLYAGWFVSGLYAWIYTWVLGLGGFSMVLAIGLTIQAGGFVQAYAHPNALAWNPARHRALWGLSLAYAGIGGLLLMGELLLGFSLRESWGF